MKKLVSDYMTAGVVSLNENENLTKAVEILNQGDFRHLPIVSDTGEIIGIISDRDLRNLQTAMAFIEEAVEGLKSEITIADVMTGNVLTVAPETPLSEAADLMIKNKYGALPVRKDGTLAGILSYTDILRAFIDTENSL